MTTYFTLTEKYEKRLEALGFPWDATTASAKRKGYGTTRNGVFFFSHDEKAKLNFCSLYMKMEFFRLLELPVFGYRLLSHLERGATIEEACELFREANKKYEREDF